MIRAKKRILSCSHFLGGGINRAQFLRQETKIEKRGFVLALCVSKALVKLSDTQRPSVLLVLRPLRTSNSNDKRLIAICFVVIAKNNSLDCFCSLLFKSLLLSVVQNKNKRTSSLMSFYFGGEAGI